MPIPVLRAADTWWVEDPTTRRVLPVDTDARTTGELLADRAAVDKVALELAGSAEAGRPPGGLDMLSSVTTPCRAVAQMVNHRSHPVDSGFDPDAVQTTLVRKASGSVRTTPSSALAGPPARLRGRARLGHGGPVPVGTEITQTGLSYYVAGSSSPATSAPGTSGSSRAVLREQGPTPRSPAGATAAPAGTRRRRIARPLPLRLWVNDELRQHQTLSDMLSSGPPAR